MTKSNQSQLLFVSIITFLFVGGCMSGGRDFPIESTHKIIAGESTQADVRRLLGEPQSRNVQAGGEAWIYVHYRSNAFGKYESKSIYVAFDEQGVVANPPTTERNSR